MKRLAERVAHIKMSPARPLEMRFFDPHDERFIIERRLPHWSQAGTICFITWRTWDSLPRAVVQRLLSERAAWLVKNGIQPNAEDWRTQVARLPTEAQREFRNKVAERWESSLDECHGECVLRRPEISKIVADSLRHFDEDRYLLTDFVIMPNHIHVLAAFLDTEGMLKQCDSWKHFTATKINRILGRCGHFWQVDDFDHLVRSEEQFDYLRDYIANNPTRAKLRPNEFIHYRRDPL